MVPQIYRELAREIFIINADEEHFRGRYHIAHSWFDLAERVLLGECDEGQTIQSLMRE